MTNLAAKTKTLYEVNLVLYAADYCPTAAAAYAVEDFFNKFKNDKYVEQLLDEQIEDVEKAIKQAKAA